MQKIINGYCRALEVFIALALAVMVVLVFGNVVLRYAFNSGITISEEVSRWLFVWMTFMGAIVAIKEHGHLGTDMLVARLPKTGKKACLIVGHLLMLYVTWLLFEGSVAQTKINWEVNAPVTGASTSQLIFICATLPSKSSQVTYSISRWPTMRQAFLPDFGRRATSMSVPR